LYDVADLATRAHQSFANFFGGQKKGDQTLRESIDIAKRYGFTIADTVASMQRFGAAGFTTKQSEGLLEFGADMMAAGRSVQDVKGIFLAMTQIQGKGKLQAEELTQQLAERGINAGRVWDILATKLHTTRENVMKLQKAGKIKSGMALNAIVQAGVEGVQGHKLGQAGAKVADATVGGLGRRMGTLIESTIFDAVDNATPALTKGMQSLFGGLNASNVSGLQDSLTKMLESVGGFLEKVGPQMPAIAANFQKAFGAAAGFKGDGWDKFAAQLPEMAANLGAIAGSLAKIAAISSSLVTGTATKGQGSFWEFMTTPMNQQGKFWSDKFSGNSKGLVSETSQSVFADDSKSRKAADDLIDGLNFGITKGAPSVAKSVENVAEGAIDAFAETTQSHSPSRVFTSHGSNISRSVALGVDSDADLAIRSTQMMAESAVAASAGASGLDPRRAIAAGSAAGAAVSSQSSALTVRVGDLYLGGGGGSGGSDAEAVREYFEGDFIAMLERHLEGVGA
jgi:tape measure domain-containing protein